MSYEEIEQVVETERGEITENLEQAQCGGWNFEESAEDKISRVKGVPGRNGEPFGNIKSGLAKRDEEDGLFKDGYLFPDIEEVQGWSTSCYLEELKRDNFPNPERLDNCASPEACFELCVQLNQWQRATCYQIDLESEEVVIVDETRCMLNNNKDNLAATKRNGDPCKTTPEDIEDGFEYEHVWMYCCTNHPLNPNNYVIVEDDDFRNKYDKTHGDPIRNCIQCSGDGAFFANQTVDFNGEPFDREVRNETGCRWGHRVGFMYEPTDRTAPINEEAVKLPDRLTSERQYQSFYRFYTVDYCRDPVRDPNNRAAHERDDVACNELRGSEDRAVCYGFYEEYDPKKVRVDEEDKKCVIGIPGSRFEGNNFAGYFGKEDAPESEPFSAVRPYNEEEDIWNPGLGDAYSLINNQVFKEKHKSDLTYPLLALDGADLTATKQLPEQTFSSGSVIRAFDDTVQNETEDQRILVEWWQELQTQMNKYFTPPVIYLRLPNLDSLFDQEKVKKVLRQFLTDNAADENQVEKPIFLEPVEVQVRAKEDLLGEVVQFLETFSLLQLEEYHIPVVVPLISRTELQALEQDWCSRFMKENGNYNGCEGEPIIQKLRAYRNQLDDVRELRSELARFAGMLLAAQNVILDTLGQWQKSVQDEYDAYLQERETREEMQITWRAVQDAYRKVHEETMQPWCHNERFTVPLYSLLDPWLPSRQSDEHDLPLTERVEVEISAEELPEVELNRQADVILDFSSFSMQEMGLLVPVLKPVQIRVDTDKLTPKLNEQPPELPDLPPVPHLRDILELESLTLDAEEADFPQIASYIELNEFADIEEKLKKTKELLENLEKTYDLFWQSTDFEGEKMDPLCSWERRDRCDYLACGETADRHCVHTESELRQSVQRITARPGLLLKEDVLSSGQQRDPDRKAENPEDIVLECPADDFSCQPLNPLKEYPREGWQITTPQKTSQSYLDKLAEERARLLHETASTGKEISAELKYRATPEQILPSFEVPEKIELKPGRQSSSQSRS